MAMLRILGRREYDASSAIWAIARQLGLHQALYSRPMLDLLPITM